MNKKEGETIVSVKQGEIITVTDLTTLRNAILDLYKNRDLTVQGTDDLGNNTSRNFKTIYDNKDAWFPASFTQGAPIQNLKGHLSDIIRKVLVINDVPNLMLAPNSQYIFANGTTSDLIAWID